MSLLLPSPIPSFPATPMLSFPLKFIPRTTTRLTARGGDIIDTFTEKSGYLFDLSASEADLLTDYSVSKIASIYKRKPLILLRCLLQICLTFGKWFDNWYVDTIVDRSGQMFKFWIDIDFIRVAELQKILEELGPAYVKIAQVVSSRPDLIPPSYLDELSLLQDRITPFSTEVALKTIEQERGLPIDQLFSKISSGPIAAAFLVQVYQARLSRSRQVVAVKVQRPGVKAAISLDILILCFLAGLIKRASKFNTDLQVVVDEGASSLSQLPMIISLTFICSNY
ncbi:hypothetical protein SLA2020_370420 [Shorea laevis]